MPFVTTNILSLNVHKELNKRWGMDHGGVHTQTQMQMGAEKDTSLSNSYLSLPIKERMRWVVGNVIPQLSVPTRISHTERLLQSVGADNLYPHADKLGIFRMRSTGC
jgi:hypothetical protein